MRTMTRVVLLLCGFLAMSGPCLAQDIDCPPDLDAQIAMIQGVGSCWRASEIAEQCAWGSSADIQTVAAALAVCEAEFMPHMSSADRGLYNHLQRLCEEKYKDMDGTMYRSMASFCRLKAAGFFSSLRGFVEE